MVELLQERVDRAVHGVTQAMLIVKGEWERWADVSPDQLVQAMAEMQAALSDLHGLQKLLADVAVQPTAGRPIPDPRKGERL